jgi:catechol 2,3-dioxygenase-like lactoylglutathione lyase family enzyme
MQASHPSAHMHHVHLFAQDIDHTVAWYTSMLGAEVAFDGEFGGVRNVFMHIGSGRINLYDQPTRPGAGGAYHHIGIQTDDLAGLHTRLLDAGVEFRSGIREFNSWRYIMCPAPDNVLLELFQIDVEKMPPALAAFFSP